jgi:hypothetical protein
MNTGGSRGFHALILAADRRSPDPVAVAAGTRCKSLARVGGREMVLRVLDALAACGCADSVTIVGPPEAALADCPELQQRISSGLVAWLAPLESPSLSAEAGLLQAPADLPVLLTTADHALLDGDILRTFTDRSLRSGADVTVGLVDYRFIRQRFPESRRTVTRLRDGSYCGCNLFALMTAKGRRAVSFWRSVEGARKHPWRVIAGLLGPLGVLRYLSRTLTLEAGFSSISRRLGLRVSAILLPHPEAGIDVDTVADLRFAEGLLRQRSPK